MPIVNGKVVIEVQCQCGASTPITAGTFGTYCSCGRGLLTNKFTDEINEELRKLVRDEKLKLRKDKKITAANFSVGSSPMLETCHMCNKPLIGGALHIIDGTLICTSCASKLPVCLGCKQPHFKESLKNGLCAECQSSFTACKNCGHVYDIRVFQPIVVDDREYCDQCVTTYLHTRGVSVRPYGHKPQPVFLGEREVGYYFGVELEIDNSVRHNEFLALANCEEIYFKHDGSLSCGIECVSHPATLKYHMEELPWRKLLSAATKTGFKSHMAKRDGTTPTCGLHIHISKTAFGRTHEERDRREAKLLVLSDKFWDQLSIFSRRDKHSLETWSKRYAGIGKDDTLDDIVRKAKGTNIANRRYAVNMEGNEKTVEIRLFRGTLNYETLIASIQLCELLVQSTRLSTKEVQSLTWEEFCQKGCDQFPEEFGKYIERLRSMKRYKGKI